jgi:aspartyl-tRNA(Asn)/glutamyl-tRNA(Gln) amidotransferase subunit B
MLAEIKSQIPELPEEKSLRYTKQYQLTEYDAAILTDEKETAAYFEQVLAELDLSDIARAKAAANWMMGPVKSFLNENNLSIADFPVKPVTIAQLISLIETGKLNFSSASSRLFNALLQKPGADPASLAEELNLVQDSNEESVLLWVEEVLNKMPDKVQEYKKGKKGLIGLFVGEVKKISKGKADPKLTNDLLIKKLQS